MWSRCQTASGDQRRSSYQQDHRLLGRLVVDPDHLEADATLTVLLGLAQGNDAKVIVLIETRKDERGTVRWHYAMAPITLHGVTVSLHGEEVIRLPFRNAPHNPKEPYYLRKLTRRNFKPPN